MNYKLVDKHENCDGGLIPASNMDVLVCLKCNCMVKFAKNEDGEK